MNLGIILRITLIKVKKLFVIHARLKEKHNKEVTEVREIPQLPL